MRVVVEMRDGHVNTESQRPGRVSLRAGYEKPSLPRVDRGVGADTRFAATSCQEENGRIITFVENYLPRCLVRVVSITYIPIRTDTSCSTRDPEGGGSPVVTRAGFQRFAKSDPAPLEIGRRWP